MKDTSRIPKGSYCYSIIGFIGTRIQVDFCPYYSVDDKRDPSENGYCSYLERGDWEDESFGLLWEGCKECGINEELPS